MNQKEDSKGTVYESLLNLKINRMIEKISH